MIAFSTVALVALGILFIVQLYWILVVKRVTRKSDVPFLPSDWPIIGHLFVLKDRDYFQKMNLVWHTEYNGTFGMYLGTNRFVFTSDVRVIEELLSSQNFLRKSSFYWIIKKFLGTGLVSSEGDLWRKRRRMITPAFHFDILNDFLSVMEQKTEDFIRLLQQYHERDESFDIQKLSKAYTLSVICETAMGMTFPIQETSGDSFKDLYESSFSLALKRGMRPWLRNDFLYSLTEDGKAFARFLAILRGLVKDLLEKRIEYRKNTTRIDSTKKRIFIDVLLDVYEQGEIDVEGIIDEVTTFVSAGYDTTSSALAWTLYCLGRNKRVQGKLYEELSSLDFKQKSMHLDHLKEMKYLDLVIKETLRLHPIAPRFSRFVTNGTVIAGKVFPECGLIVDLYPVMHNPEIWEDPESFVPERFERLDDEARVKRSTFAFTPFSAGPRNCVGQRFAMTELKSTLYHMVRCFEIEALQTESEIKETLDGLNVSANGLILRMKPRN